MKPATKEWVKKAEEDWRTALILSESPTPVYSNICFHCQQSIEKYFKALIIEKGKKPSRTHDLYALTMKLKENEFVGWKKELSDVSAYAVEVRYPFGEEVGAKQANRAMEIAGEIRKRARKLLDIKNNDN